MDFSIFTQNDQNPLVQKWNDHRNAFRPAVSRGMLGCSYKYLYLYSRIIMAPVWFGSLPLWWYVFCTEDNDHSKNYTDPFRFHLVQCYGIDSVVGGPSISHFVMTPLASVVTVWLLLTVRAHAVDTKSVVLHKVMRSSKRKLFVVSSRVFVAGAIGIIAFPVGGDLATLHMAAFILLVLASVCMLILIIRNFPIHTTIQDGWRSWFESWDLLTGIRVYTTLLVVVCISLFIDLAIISMRVKSDPPYTGDKWLFFILEVVLSTGLCLFPAIELWEYGGGDMVNAVVDSIQKETEKRQKN
jgi:hypothetical protein